MLNGTLDRIDRRILEVLQRDGRLPNNELAAAVSLSPSPCLRRVKALEDAGLIRRYVALLDPLKLGLTLLAFVHVKLEKKGQMATDELSSAVQAWSEVTECCSLTGEMDFLLRVHVRDLEHFSGFLSDKLLKLPGVIDVKSSFALKRIKQTTVLPTAID
jgi:Lrp/AsnC family leucine-responsive transcriptional regulator